MQYIWPIKLYVLQSLIKVAYARGRSETKKDMLEIRLNVDWIHQHLFSDIYLKTNLGLNNFEHWRIQ